MSAKGFRATKTPTKQQLINSHGDQLQQVVGQLRALSHMVVQSSHQIKQLKEEVSVLVTLLRYSVETSEASTDNDFVVIDTIGQIVCEDGSLSDPFQGGTLITHAVSLDDKSRYVPGFVEGLVGRKANDRFNLTVTFPADYQSKEIAGKKVLFDTTVLKVYKPCPLNTAILDKSKALEAAKAKAEVPNAPELNN